ncbi:MAG: NAD-binding protein, partial [Oscillospiraceae bacterium]|nr:NAD-binding protein [Oscillospiraceae bacterium]
AMIPKGDFIFRKGDRVSISGSPRSTSHFFRKIGLSTGQVQDVIIVGGGKIGYYLAYQLTGTSVSTKIIEADADRCEELSELLPSTLIIHGSSLNRGLLMEEGLETAQAVVSLTNLDEENMMLSMLASIRNPGAKVVTKVSHLPFQEVLDRMDLGSLICPKEITALSIVQYIRALRNSRGSNIETLYRILDDKVEALEFHIQAPSAVLNTPLQTLPLRPDLLISTIIRDGRAFTPRGSDQLKLGDGVIVVTTHSGLRDITDILQHGARAGKDAAQ